MATPKPDLTRIWANTANPVDVIDPDVGSPGKFSLGWLAELPPYEYFNFLQNMFTAGLAHMNEQGISIWDASTTYPIAGLAKGSDGLIYKATVEQSGNDPVSDGGSNWVTLMSLNTTNTLEILYPVGELLITIRSGSPETWLGFGTWTRFGHGRALMGYDPGDVDHNTIEETGGAKTHTLTEAEIPAHTHGISEGSNVPAAGQLTSGDDFTNIISFTQTSGSTGGGAAHNNLPPYITTFFWKRVT